MNKNHYIVQDEKGNVGLDYAADLFNRLQVDGRLAAGFPWANTGTPHTFANFVNSLQSKVDNFCGSVLLDSKARIIKHGN